MTHGREKISSVIAKMRNEGKTQVEIAKRFGVTRQWIQQIEKRLFPEGRQGMRRVPRRYEFICKQCGKKEWASTQRRSFCSRACFFASRRKVRSPKESSRLLGEKKRRERERAARYYEIFKQRPDWREILRIRNKKYSK